MPELMGGDIPRYVWQRERYEVRGAENNQPSTAKALRVDADGRNVRTTRQGDNNVSFDAIEARGLPSTPSADHSGAEPPKHMFRQALCRRSNGTKTKAGPYRFQLKVPVPRGFLYRDEAAIARITEYRDRPNSRGTRSGGSASTASGRHRADKNDKNGVRPILRCRHVQTRSEPALTPNGSRLSCGALVKE
jgi:hypothetical protein